MRSQKGSITLYVLVSILFFIFILVGVYVNFVNKASSEQKQIEQIQSDYNQYDTEDKLDDLYSNMIIDEGKEENVYNLSIYFKDIEDDNKLYDGEVSVYKDELCNNLVFKTEISEDYVYDGILESGNYYVEVSRVPAGYNSINEILAYSIIEGQNNIWEIEVTPGTILPNSGGILWCSTHGEDYLTFTADSEGVILSNLEVSIYRVGYLSNDDKIILEGDFEDYPIDDVSVDANLIKKMATYLESCCIEDVIQPFMVDSTNEERKSYF